MEKTKTAGCRGLIGSESFQILINRETEKWKVPFEFRDWFLFLLSFFSAISLSRSVCVSSSAGPARELNTGETVERENQNEWENDSIQNQNQNFYLIIKHKDFRERERWRRREREGKHFSQKGFFFHLWEIAANETEW